MIEPLTRSTSLYLCRRGFTCRTVFLLGARLRSSESFRALFLRARVRCRYVFSREPRRRSTVNGTSVRIPPLLATIDKFQCPLSTSRCRPERDSCPMSLIIRRFCRADAASFSLSAVRLTVTFHLDLLYPRNHALTRGSRVSNIRVIKNALFFLFQKQLFGIFQFLLMFNLTMISAGRNVVKKQVCAIRVLQISAGRPSCPKRPKRPVLV